MGDFDTFHPMSHEIDLSILVPCLNEAETLATCIRKAREFLEGNAVIGEVLVADNGSADGSQAISRAEGARVVDVGRRGHGAALVGGIRAARGRHVIMGDAAGRDDFSSRAKFLAKLRIGFNVAMENRFLDGIALAAMPPLHGYLGDPVLSFVGKQFFKHCQHPAQKTRIWPTFPRFG